MPTTQATSIYDLDYFSGAQMFLYIGEVWVDEVTSLQYAVQQEKIPIYGYASQLWDDCAPGQVVVQGQFTINFKEQGYLWAVLNRYNTTMGKRPGYGSGEQMQMQRQSIERILQGEATRGDQYKFYMDLAGYSSYDTKLVGTSTGKKTKYRGRDTTFEDIVERFEDAVWAKSITNQDLRSIPRRADDNSFDGFDMYVVFGNYAEPKANHTVQKIIDVRLTSQGKVIKIDGEPIQESYTFLAQTVA